MSDKEKHGVQLAEPNDEHAGKSPGAAAGSDSREC